MVYHLFSHHTEVRGFSKPLHIFLFIAGLVSGFLLTRLFFDRQDILWSSDDAISSTATETPVVTARNRSFEYPNLIENSIVADRLFNEVRITCFVITLQKGIEVLAQNAHRNWGHRCNQVVYISSEEDNRLDNVVPVEGTFYEWQQTKNAFKYLHEHHSADTDFFVRADHWSFIIPENIRYMVYPYPADFPLFFGSNLKWKPETGEASAADYVLSRAALDMIVEYGLSEPNTCKGNDTAPAGAELTKCLLTLTITEGNSRDVKGLERFLTFEKINSKLPEVGPVGEKSDLYFRKYLFKQTKMLNQYSSDFPVSFHPLQPAEMTALNCLINIIQPYGIVDRFADLPPKLSNRELAAMPLVHAHTKSPNLE